MPGCVPALSAPQGAPFFADFLLLGLRPRPSGRPTKRAFTSLREDVAPQRKWGPRQAPRPRRETAGATWSEHFTESPTVKKSSHSRVPRDFLRSHVA